MELFRKEETLMAQRINGIWYTRCSGHELLTYAFIALYIGCVFAHLGEVFLSRKLQDASTLGWLAGIAQAYFFVFHGIAIKSVAFSLNLRAHAWHYTLVSVICAAADGWSAWDYPKMRAFSQCLSPAVFWHAS